MANLTPTIVVFAAFLAVESAPLAAQSYRDFMLVRNRQQPYKSLLQIRAGWRTIRLGGALGRTEKQEWGGRAR